MFRFMSFVLFLCYKLTVNKQIAVIHCEDVASKSFLSQRAYGTLNVTYVMLSFDKSLTQFFHHGRSDLAALQTQLIWNLWKNS